MALDSSQSFPESREINKDKLSFMSASFSKIKRFGFLLLPLILTLLYVALSDRAPYYDSVRNLIVAQEMQEKGIPTYFEFAYWQKPPFPMYLWSFFASLFNLHVYSTGKFFTLFFAFLSLILAYKIVQGITGNNRYAIMATILLGVHPLMVQFSGEIMDDMPNLFAFLATLFFFMSGIRKEKPFYFALAGLAFGIGMLTRVQILVVLPALLVYAFMEKHMTIFSKKYITHYLIFALVAFLAMTPYLYYRSTNTQMSIFYQALTETLTGRAAFSPTGSVGSPWYYYILDSPNIFSFPLIFFIVGTIFFAKRREKNLIFPFLWFLIFFVAMHFFSVKGNRLLIPLFLPFMLMAIYGIEAIAHNRKGILYGTFAVLAGLTLLHSLLNPIYGGHYPFEWKMWDYILSLDEPLATQDLYRGTTIHMAYGTVKLLTGVYADFFHADADSKDAVAAAIMLNTPYVLFAGNVEKEPPLEKVKLFEECNCTLFRIDNQTYNSIRSSGAILKTYGDGKPVDGVRVSVYDYNGKLVYHGRSNKGEFLLPIANADIIVSAMKVCYTENHQRLRLENGSIRACEIKTRPSPSQPQAQEQYLECNELVDKIEISYKGCLNHQFPLDRF